MRFTLKNEELNGSVYIDSPFTLGKYVNDCVYDFVSFAQEHADHAIQKRQYVSMQNEPRDEYWSSVDDPTLHYRSKRQFRYELNIELQKMPMDEYLDTAANDNQQLDLFDDYLE